MNELTFFFKHRRKGIQAFKRLHKLNLAVSASISREEIIKEESNEYISERCYKFTFYSQEKREALLNAMGDYRDEIINVEVLEDER